MHKTESKATLFRINQRKKNLHTESIMPLTTIDIRTTYPESVEIDIIESVQRALLDVLKLPENDRDISLRVHAPHRMIVSRTLTQPEKRTVVSITLFPGRSTDAKRRLYQAIVANLENCTAAIARDHVLISLREEPFEHWGIRGGQAACDVELDFSTQVT